MFDDHGNIRGETTAIEPDKKDVIETGKTIPIQLPPSSLSQTASLLDAKLLNKGTYFSLKRRAAMLNSTFPNTRFLKWRMGSALSSQPAATNPS